MRSEISQRNLWKDTVFAGFYISSILADLLATRPAIGEEADASITTLEAFRLAAVLYVGDLRTKFGIDVLPSGLLYVTKFCSLLRSSLIFDWKAPSALLIWILTVAFICQCLFPEQRVWFSDMFNSALAARGITQFE
jgi:hypothetical protein